MIKKAIGYVRVSTSEQGRSGLGLKVQESDIKEFCKNEGIQLIKILSEVESGKGFDALEKRPVLSQALNCAKKESAYIIVNKLDRLGRDVAFISSLMANKTPFIAAQLGRDADPFMLHLYAALSEKERELISTRTKAALQILKARGVQLGNQTNLDEARLKSNAINKKLASDFARTVSDIIEGYRIKGLSMGNVANELNKLGVKTRRGGQWHASTVKNIIDREKTV
ncbi:recombinase family protein [Bathymodiolus platifrons methanotrophic gill symbiont]|uniref:recombinase family protein n=1 Tax=Bathymodiolus platifrons methanotrophic gill symbiont TaxID=113268 RepID=UPI001B69AEA3|nr:recombinase family protein [Bathymodiolus platifrons methanotrophic gill symbiont]GFO76219.1 recombinase family protein [Bathymodiolus platifrons methanotrophic gill symbiont]